MTEKAKNKRDELAEDFIKKNLNIVWWQPTLIMKVAHQAGFDAGYQVAMDEANGRIQKLREALEFYANEKNWWGFQKDRTDSVFKSDLELLYKETLHGGKTARAALKEDEEAQNG